MSYVICYLLSVSCYLLYVLCYLLHLISSVGDIISYNNMLSYIILYYFYVIGYQCHVFEQSLVHGRVNNYQKLVHKGIKNQHFDVPNRSIFCPRRPCIVSRILEAQSPKNLHFLMEKQQFS